MHKKNPLPGAWRETPWLQVISPWEHQAGTTEPTSGRRRRNIVLYESVMYLEYFVFYCSALYCILLYPRCILLSCTVLSCSPDSNGFFSFLSCSPSPILSLSCHCILFLVLIVWYCVLLSCPVLSCLCLSSPIWCFWPKSSSSPHQHVPELH